MGDNSPFLLVAPHPFFPVDFRFLSVSAWSKNEFREFFLPVAHLTIASH
jgi:hypothetical protein